MDRAPAQRPRTALRCMPVGLQNIRLFFSSRAGKRSRGLTFGTAWGALGLVALTACDDGGDVADARASDARDLPATEAGLVSLRGRDASSDAARRDAYPPLDAAPSDDANDASEFASDVGAGSAADSASLSADGDPNKCSVQGRWCDLYASNDRGTVSFSEREPQGPDADGRKVLSLQLLGPRTVTADPSPSEHWSIEFAVRAAQGMDGVLSFTAKRPLGVGSLPSPLSYRSRFLFQDCIGDYANHEPVLLSQATIRDPQGKLLIARGHSPLLQNGSALTSDGDLSEIELSWREAGCAVCSEPAAAKLVEFVVSSASGEAAIAALPGETVALRIGGEPYFFRSSGTWRPDPQPGYCGFGFWSIYRKGFWEQLDPSKELASH